MYVLVFDEISATTTLANELLRGKVTDTTFQKVKRIGEGTGISIKSVSKIPPICRTI